MAAKNVFRFHFGNLPGLFMKISFLSFICKIMFL